jgi:hypothetical protein
VKLLRANKKSLVFLLSESEKAVLLDILELYPCIPPGHRRHRLHARAAVSSDLENQCLLEEALAEQRAKTKRQLEGWMKSPTTFKATPAGAELHLRTGDLDWLLQVLNDVRVGSWIALGEPEELPRDLPADSAAALHACAMELAGLFQMTLLEILEESAGD